MVNDGEDYKAYTSRRGNATLIVREQVEDSGERQEYPNIEGTPALYPSLANWGALVPQGRNVGLHVGGNSPVPVPPGGRGVLTLDTPYIVQVDKDSGDIHAGEMVSPKVHDWKVTRSEQSGLPEAIPPYHENIDATAKVYDIGLALACVSQVPSISPGRYIEVNHIRSPKTVLRSYSLLGDSDEAVTGYGSEVYFDLSEYTSVNQTMCQYVPTSPRSGKVIDVTSSIEAIELSRAGRYSGVLQGSLTVNETSSVSGIYEFQIEFYEDPSRTGGLAGPGDSNVSESPPITHVHNVTNPGVSDAKHMATKTWAQFPFMINVMSPTSLVPRLVKTSGSSSWTLQNATISLEYLGFTTNQDI